MNLREEIENIILNDRIYFANDNNEWVKESVTADKILKRIEIRLDGMEHTYRNHQPCSYKLSPFQILDDIRDYMGVEKKKK